MQKLECGMNDNGFHHKGTKDTKNGHKGFILPFHYSFFASLRLYTHTLGRLFRIPHSTFHIRLKGDVG
jgi:hypothetical protein